MGRPSRAVNDKLTMEIGIDELEIVDYADGQYIAVNVDHEVPLCPKCGHRCKNHKLRKRFFTDFIQDDSGKGKLVYLRYDQYMYRCLNKDCHHLFSKEISFARKNSKVTKRFEKQVARMALSRSYGEIKSKLGDNLARSTIKDVLERWTERQERKKGQVYTPRVLCMFPFQTNGLDYIVIANGENKNRLIIDVLPSYSDGRIIEKLNEFDMKKVEEIVIDTSPQIVSLLRDYFPNVEIQIHSGCLLHSARIDFKSIIQEDGLYIRNEVKESLLKSPNEFVMLEGSGDIIEQHNKTIALELGRIKKETEEHPRINAAYDLFIELHKALLPEADFEKVTSWKESVQLAATELHNAERTLGFLHEDDFGLTLDYIETYMKELMNFYLRRTFVTQDIYDKLIQLNAKLMRFHTCSEDSLRCKILYLADPMTEDINGINYWYGVPVEKIIEKIEKLR